MLLIWFVYIILQQLAAAGLGFNGYHAIANLLLLGSLLFLFRTEKISFQFISAGVFIIAFIQSSICVLQWIGLLKSPSDYFQVTGSLTNPNVTAMFLAMVCPLTLYLWRFPKYRSYIAFASSIMLLSLILLNCRTAYIGLGSIFLLAIHFKFKVFSHLGLNKRTGLIFLLFSFSLGLVIPVVSKIYHAKKDSADGRILIYKLSASMAKNAPFFGIGYGNFERDYNIYQADYLSKNPKAEGFAQAGHVKMAYNDYLQNTIEGGLVGLVLFAGSIILLLNSKKKEVKSSDKESTFDAFAIGKLGVLAFAIMAMVNFTIEAVPVMFLFIVYAALIVKQTKSFCTLKNISANYFQVSATIVAIYICYLTFNFISANRKNAIAKALARSNQTEKAIVLLNSLKEPLRNLESYHSNFAYVLYLNNNSENTLKEILLTKKHTSDPKLFRLAGQCYLKLGQLELAAKEFETESKLTPTVFAPRYYLMQTALKAHNMPLAINTAQGIVDLKPKIKSNKVFFYKNQASILLKNTGLKRSVNLTKKKLTNPLKNWQSADFSKTNETSQPQQKW
ncbi:O-antigen ligase family protein [Pedobacter arcticus]|uniref:O-antigen ligase family protein n=1 Tax=Pedobacter arcticus TaxID=752140 RepID=UPI0012B64A0A|nr:O-antigen ligase family protein [Pedobacter arcticus]